MIFRGDRHHGDVEGCVKPEHSRVRQVHAGGPAASLPAEHCNRAGLLRRFQRLAKLREDQHGILPRLPLHRDEENLSLPRRGVFQLIIQIEDVDRQKLALGSARRRGTYPAHRIHVQLAPDRGDNLPFRGNALPTLPQLPLLRADVLEPDRFHLGQAPFDGLLRGRRPGDASADVVVQFGEIVVGVRVHQTLPRYGSQRRQCAVFRGPFGYRPLVRERDAGQRPQKCNTQ